MPYPAALVLACAVAFAAPAARLRAQLPPPPPGGVEGGATLASAPLPELPIAASLPATGAAPPGFAPSLVGTLDAIFAEAIAEGATPGASLVVGHGGEIVLARGWGRVDWDPASASVDEHTVYDLASVTKVAATTVAAMILAEEGRLSLGRTVASYLEGWPTDGARGRITIRDLLHHRSGLPAFAALYRSVGQGVTTLEALAEVPMMAAPGSEERYSDLDMILLGLVVERVTGQPLETFLQRRVYGPLGMARTTFRPLDAGVARADIAPTEVIRHEQLWGVVHDPNARGLGGVAGNAGLFSSARDLAVLASSLLWERPHRLVCRATVRRFTRSPRGSRYALGWDTPTRRSSWADDLSASAFGHTGYTGTSLWIDPELDVFVVLLTNRVNPSANNRRHLALRRDVHEAIRQALVDPWGEGVAAGWFDAPRLVHDDGVRDEDGWRSVDGCRAEVAREALARMGGAWPRIW